MKHWKVAIDAKTPHRTVKWPRTITVNGPETEELAIEAAIASMVNHKTPDGAPDHLKPEEIISCEAQELHATKAN